MKTLARFAAVCSFTCFIIPGVWLLLKANPETEAFGIVLGFLFSGIAFFAGPILWMAGERFNNGPRTVPDSPSRQTANKTKN